MLRYNLPVVVDGILSPVNTEAVAAKCWVLTATYYFVFTVLSTCGYMYKLIRQDFVSTATKDYCASKMVWVVFVVTRISQFLRIAS